MKININLIIYLFFILILIAIIFVLNPQFSEHFNLNKKDTETKKAHAALNILENHKIQFTEFKPVVLNDSERPEDYKEELTDVRHIFSYDADIVSYSEKWNQLKIKNKVINIISKEKIVNEFERYKQQGCNNFNIVIGYKYIHKISKTPRYELRIKKITKAC